MKHERKSVSLNVYGNAVKKLIHTWVCPTFLQVLSCFSGLFSCVVGLLLQTGTVLIMWDHEIRAMASTHAITAASVFMATVIPAVFVPGFSVFGTHLLWLYSVSGSVAAVSVAVFWLLGISPPTKKHTLGYKVRTKLYTIHKYSGLT